MKSFSLAIQANERYFPVVLFIMLYKAAPISESVDEILKCDHSNKTRLFADQLIRTFESLDEIVKCNYSN